MTKVLFFSLGHFYPARSDIRRYVAQRLNLYRRLPLTDIHGQLILSDDLQRAPVPPIPVYGSVIPLIASSSAPGLQGALIEGGGRVKTGSGVEETSRGRLVKRRNRNRKRTTFNK
jgi:hypothetical protein